MADSCQTYPNIIWSAYEDAEIRLGYLTSAISYLQSHSCYSGTSSCQDRKRIRDINMQYILERLVYGSKEDFDTFRVPYMLKECLAPAELTMETLISCMLTATPDDVLYFIGLVDAYRQSVWNKPFNQEMYAALARGFMEWE